MDVIGRAEEWGWGGGAGGGGLGMTAEVWKVDCRNAVFRDPRHVFVDGRFPQQAVISALEFVTHPILRRAAPRAPAGRLQERV